MKLKQNALSCSDTVLSMLSLVKTSIHSCSDVSLFDAKKTKDGKSGLDREGMILVALLSGGDYATEGLKGFGAKIACEAARAGYGKSLCSISRSDEDGLANWRNSLVYELQTNESQFFKTKHKSLRIPDDFPSREILGYYTHPVVSSTTKIEKLKEEILWDGEVDVPGLRNYVKEAFDWTNKVGATKFVRNLAPALLVHKLRLRANRRDSGYGDLVLTQMNEMEYVRKICGRREHFSMDGKPELRVVFAPLDIVGLNLEDEHDNSGDYGRDGLAPVNDDDQIEAYVSEDEAPKSKRVTAAYDPTKPDKAWIPESIAKVGVPLKVEDYEEAERKKQLPKVKAVRKTKAAVKGGMPNGALDKFVKISKSVEAECISARAPLRTITASQPVLPPVYLAPSLDRLPASQPVPTSKSKPLSLSTRSSTDALPSKTTSKTRIKAKTTAPVKSRPNANPWSLAKPATSSQVNPSITKSLDTYSLKSTDSPASANHELYYITSSPLASPRSPPPPSRPNSRKHTRSQSSPTPPQIPENEIPLPDTVTISRRTRKGRSHPVITPSKSQPQPNSRSKSPSQPSSRKKISPDRESASHPPTSHEEHPSIPEPVARKLSFSAPAQSPSAQLPGSSLSADKASDNANEGEDQDHDESCGDFPSIQNMLSPAPAPASGLTSSSSISTSKSQAKSNIVISLDSSPPQPVRSSQSHHTTTSSSSLKPTHESDQAQPTTKPESKAVAKKGKRFITLRESLEGSWKEVTEEEMLEKEKEKRSRAGKGLGNQNGKEVKRWRFSEVEMLDLTSE